MRYCMATRKHANPPILIPPQHLTGSDNENFGLEGARNVASQEQAQQQLSRFLSYGQGYQAQTVQMFH
jgi:conjugal transfer/entry exclusion protein